MKLAFFKPCRRLFILGDFALLFALNREFGRGGSVDSFESSSSTITGSDSRLLNGGENRGVSLFLWPF